jgi:hypothetical protein
MARLRPLNVRRRKPSWYDEDNLPPAPLGSRRAQLEAQRDFLHDYDRMASDLDDRPSPSYRRPLE